MVTPQDTQEAERLWTIAGVPYTIVDVGYTARMLAYGREHPEPSILMNPDGTIQASVPLLAGGAKNVQVIFDEDGKYIDADCDCAQIDLPDHLCLHVSAVLAKVERMGGIYVAAQQLLPPEPVF